LYVTATVILPGRGNYGLLLFTVHSLTEKCPICIRRDGDAGWSQELDMNSGLGTRALFLPVLSGGQTTMLIRWVAFEPAFVPGWKNKLLK
jgi:hypothetical protein